MNVAVIGELVRVTARGVRFNAPARDGWLTLGVTGGAVMVSP